MTISPTISHWLKQSTWLSTGHCVHRLKQSRWLSTSHCVHRLKQSRWLRTGHCVHRLKQSRWLRTGHCGGCWLRVAENRPLWRPLATSGWEPATVEAAGYEWRPRMQARPSADKLKLVVIVSDCWWYIDGCELMALLQVFDPVFSRDDKSTEVCSWSRDVQQDSREAHLTNAGMQFCPLFTRGHHQIGYVGGSRWAWSW